MKLWLPFPRWHIIGAGLLALAAVLWGLIFLPSQEYGRAKSPDGRFYAIVSYRQWRKFVPMMPGSSGDKPGWVSIYSREGRFLGTIPLAMVQMAADLDWREGEVGIPGESTVRLPQQ